MKAISDFSGQLMNIFYLCCGGSGEHSHNHGNYNGDHMQMGHSVTTKYIDPVNSVEDKTYAFPVIYPVCNMNRGSVKEIAGEHGKGHSQGCC